jgi:DNA-binding MarR family transcriptional regulator
VTLNIDAGQKDARRAARAARAALKSAPAQRELVQQALAELTAWNPREFITAFQRWHQGSISLIHLNVLTLLEASGPMSMGRLADALDISVASITGVIDRMEARGLVERRRDAEDRRVVLVQPAKGARKVFGEIDNRRRKGMQMLLARLSDEELTGLLQGHRALRQARADFARSAEFGALDKAGATARLRARARASRAPSGMRA